MACRVASFCQPLRSFSRVQGLALSHRTFPSSAFSGSSGPVRAVSLGHQRTIKRSISTQIKKEEMDSASAQGTSEKGVQDWQKKAPYKIHEPNDKFNARYEASCHCGKVKYQLSREEPLDSKLCHCTTCQTQHGELDVDRLNIVPVYLPRHSRPFPMGRHLSQGGHQLFPRSSRSGMVRPDGKVNRAQASLQGPLFLLPQPDHG